MAAPSSPAVSRKAEEDEPLNLMDEYHKLMEQSIADVAGNNKKLRAALRNAQVSGQVPDAADKKASTLTVQQLSLALTQTTDRAFELLCKQELSWYTKYTEVSRRCQKEYASAESRFSADFEAQKARYAKDANQWREDEKTVCARVAELEEQMKALGIEELPAVTLASTSEADILQQAMDKVTTLDEGGTSDGVDEDAEEGIFENSWVEQNSSGAAIAHTSQPNEVGKVGSFSQLSQKESTELDTHQDDATIDESVERPNPLSTTPSVVIHSGSSMGITTNNANETAGGSTTSTNSTSMQPNERSQEDATFQHHHMRKRSLTLNSRSGRSTERTDSQNRSDTSVHSNSGRQRSRSSSRTRKTHEEVSDLGSSREGFENIAIY